MKTKIDAAKICQLSGCQMVIANGLLNRPIKKITDENNCTWFLPKVSKLDARKKWIISSVSPKGEVVIDDGATKALSNGKSLLAAGITKITGIFNKGENVLIVDQNEKHLARGLASFNSKEIDKIIIVVKVGRTDNKAFEHTIGALKKVSAPIELFLHSLQLRQALYIYSQLIIQSKLFLLKVQSLFDD